MLKFRRNDSNWSSGLNRSIEALTRNTNQRLLDERIALKSSTKTEATLMFVDDHALLNHATAVSGHDLETFPAALIRPRFARLARNSANIQQAPIAVTL